MPIDDDFMIRELGLPFRENPDRHGEILNVRGQCVAMVPSGGPTWTYDYTAFIVAACNHLASVEPEALPAPVITPDHEFVQARFREFLERAHDVDVEDEP